VGLAIELFQPGIFTRCKGDALVKGHMITQACLKLQWNSFNYSLMATSMAMSCQSSLAAFQMA